MFLIKFWAFYNGGQGLFMDVDFFFFGGGLRNVSPTNSAIQTEGRRPFLASPTASQTFKKLRTQRMRKLAMKQKMVHHFPRTMAHATLIN